MSFSAFYLQLFTAVPMLSQRSHWALFFLLIAIHESPIIATCDIIFSTSAIILLIKLQSFLSQYSYCAHAEQEETHVFLLTWQQFDESGFISIRVM